MQEFDKEKYDNDHIALHAFNPLRIEYINGVVQHVFGADCDKSKISLLDVGCGSGILSYPLSNIGYDVVGIDKDSNAIGVARSLYQDDVVFINDSVFNYHTKFDVVVASEVIEHVDDVHKFLIHCSSLTKRALVISTINKTLKSFLYAIVGAEYITRIVPINTHSWSMFVRPDYMNSVLQDTGFQIFDRSGLSYNIFSGDWSKCESESVNYIISYVRK